MKLPDMLLGSCRRGMVLGGGLLSGIGMAMSGAVASILVPNDNYSVLLNYIAFEQELVYETPRSEWIGSVGTAGYPLFYFRGSRSDTSSQDYSGYNRLSLFVNEYNFTLPPLYGSYRAAYHLPSAQAVLSPQKKYHLANMYDLRLQPGWQINRYFQLKAGLFLKVLGNYGFAISSPFDQQQTIRNNARAPDKSPVIQQLFWRFADTLFLNGNGYQRVGNLGVSLGISLDFLPRHAAYDFYFDVNYVAQYGFFTREYVNYSLALGYRNYLVDRGINWSLFGKLGATFQLRSRVQTSNQTVLPPRERLGDRYHLLDLKLGFNLDFDRCAPKKSLRFACSLELGTNHVLVISGMPITYIFGVVLTARLSL